MQKKIIALICVLMMSFSLVGCNTPTEPVASDPSSSAEHPTDAVDESAPLELALPTWPVTQVDVDFIPLAVEVEGHEPVMIVGMWAVGDRIYIEHLPGAGLKHIGVWDIASGREIGQLPVDGAFDVVFSDPIIVLEAASIRHFDLDLNKIDAFPLSQTALDVMHGGRTQPQLSPDGTMILGTDGAGMPFILDPFTDALRVLDNIALPDGFEAAHYTFIAGTHVPHVYCLVGHNADGSRTIMLTYDVEAEVVLQYSFGLGNDSTQVGIDLRTAKLFHTGLGGYLTDCSLVVGPGNTVYDLKAQRAYRLDYEGSPQVTSLGDKVVCIHTIGNEAYIGTFDK